MAASFWKIAFLGQIVLRGEEISALGRGVHFLEGGLTSALQGAADFGLRVVYRITIIGRSQETLGP